MKKFTKSLMIFCLTSMVGITAFAQTPKSCDLGVTMTTPAEGGVFNVGDAFVLKFDIKNNGPAAIVPTDTIYYKHNAANNIYRVTGKSIASGATVSSDPLTLGTFKNDGTTDLTESFCVELMKQSDIVNIVGTDTTPVTVTYTDPVATNNKDCNSITVKKKPTGIFDLGNGTKEALSLYPNPSAGIVNFNISLEKSENVIAIVRDVVGREVMQKDFGKVQAGSATPFTLDIARLNAGIYMVEVNVGDKKAIGKVTKQN